MRPCRGCRWGIMGSSDFRSIDRRSWSRLLTDLRTPAAQWFPVTPHSRSPLLLACGSSVNLRLCGSACVAYTIDWGRTQAGSACSRLVVFLRQFCGLIADDTLRRCRDGPVDTQVCLSAPDSIDRPPFSLGMWTTNQALSSNVCHFLQQTQPIGNGRKSDKRHKKQHLSDTQTTTPKRHTSASGSRIAWTTRGAGCGGCGHRRR